MGLFLSYSVLSSLLAALPRAELEVCVGSSLGPQRAERPSEVVKFNKGSCQLSVITIQMSTEPAKQKRKDKKKKKGNDPIKKTLN